MGQNSASGQPSYGEIVYNNTTLDAVRLLGDQAVLLHPRNERAGQMLQNVAMRLLGELEMPAPGPSQVFRHVVPEITRKLTVQHLRQVVTAALEDQQLDMPSRPSSSLLYLQASHMAEASAQDILNRLSTGKGLQAGAGGPSYEQSSITRVANVVTARLDYQQSKASARTGAAQHYWDQAWNPTDAPAVMLADSVRETAEWAVSRMFDLAVRGENTAGRLATAFGIRMSKDHLIHHHDAVTDPSARMVGELRVAVGVLSESLEQGRLREEATRIYQSRMVRLGLPSPAPAEADYQRAAVNGQHYLNNVVGMMSDVMNSNRRNRPSATVTPLVPPARRDLH